MHLPRRVARDAAAGDAVSGDERAPATAFARLDEDFETTRPTSTEATEDALAAAAPIASQASRPRSCDLLD